MNKTILISIGLICVLIAAAGIMYVTYTKSTKEAWLDYNLWFEANQKSSALEDDGKNEEAIKIYDKILEIYPNKISILYGKSDLLNRMGKYQEALQVLEKILQLNTKEDAAWQRKGKILAELGQFEKALEALNKSIKYNPDSMSILNKGDILIRLNRLDEAIKIFDKLINDNDNDDIYDIFCGDSWYGKAICYSLKNDKINTLTSLSKSVKYKISPFKEYARENESFKWLWEDEEFKKITQE
ncbi:MAG TPA: tetratricopeptide repeat protein [Planctomycetota bacterium]|nr:tetratricopeptide repeat protein [Planctomycetota bacterium]